MATKGFPAMDRNAIDEAWQSYARSVLVRHAGPVDWLETRRAFYAGVEAMFQLAVAIGAPEVTEDEAIKTMTAIRQELVAFADAVKAGWL